jgi:integrase
VGAKKLTAAAVARLKPRSDGARREVRDGASGLILIVHPTGSRSWALRYRRPAPDRRMAKLVLGSVVDVVEDEALQVVQATPEIGMPLTLAGARVLAAKVQARRRLGRDPAAEWIAQKARRSAAIGEGFAAAALGFVEQHARPKTRRWRETAMLLGWRPVEGKLEPVPKGLSDRWHAKPVSSVTSSDVHALVDEARRRGIPGLRRRNGNMSDARARAMLACLSKLFSWLIAQRTIEQNPCDGIERPKPPRPRDRVLTDDEIRWLWIACDQVGEPFGPLLKLLLVTGQRREEVARMKRSELSADGTSWLLPEERTKNKRPHAVPLTALAREVINGAREINGGPGFVFSTTGRTPVSGFSRIKRRIDAAMLACAQREAEDANLEVNTIVIPPWRIHDLRRTVATGLQRLGVAMPVTEKVLNHVSGSHGGIAGVYQRHEYTNEKRVALEAWANLLIDIVSLKLDDRVIAITARRAGQ